MPIRGVIFDMDGVLLDTEPVWRRIEVDVLGLLGVPLTYEDTAATMGMRIEEVVALHHSRHPWQEPSIGSVSKEIEQGVIDFVTARGSPMPGVDESLAAVRTCGLVAALATSSSHRLITAVVDRLGIREAFATMTSADDVGVSKPEPAVYIASAQSIGIAPEECLAVEDSRNGILSALAAGMTVCAVPDSHWNGDPDVARAHWRLESLREFPAILQHLLPARSPEA